MGLFKKSSVLMALSSVVVALSAFAGVKPALSAERPRDEAFRTELKKELSSLNVPVEASANDLARILNQTIGKELYRGSTKTRGVTADILRNGPIAVSAADNYLYFSLPITLSLSYGMFETEAVPFTLKFKANARVTPDWRLNIELHYLGLSDLLAENIGIGPFSLKPRSIVEGITQPVQRMLSDVITAKVNDTFALKSQIAKVWYAAQKPVLLDRSYNAWLKLTPRQVMLSPLYTQNNRVKVGVGISTYAELVVGPEPAAQPPVPLPDLKLLNSFDKDFMIAMNADLYYKDILTIASPLLLNKEFNSDGKTITIKNLDIYGNGDKLVVKVETQGSLDGIVYLTGKPHFDPKTDLFSVEDVDFDMQSESLLLQSAAWFLHGTIRNSIQETLNLDLTKRIEQSRDMARKAIAHVRLADHVILNGTIKSLKFSDALVQKDRISIQVYAEGDSVISFQ